MPLLSDRSRKRLRQLDAQTRRARANCITDALRLNKDDFAAYLEKRRLADDAQRPDRSRYGQGVRAA